MVEKTVNKDSFTEYTNHCVATAKRLETRGNLEAAVVWRERAAKTYGFIDDKENQREQYLLIAGIRERIATMNERRGGSTGWAAFQLEQAGEMYINLLDKEKAKGCYSKAIELHRKVWSQNSGSFDVMRSNSLERLMRKVEEVGRL